MELTSAQRSYLTKLAHDIQPVVMLGKAGLTDQVLAALSQALDDHELVKLRFQGFKEEKRTLAVQAGERSSAVLVRLLGNNAVYFRVSADPDKRKIRLPRG